MSSLFELHKISTCRRPLHLLIPYLLCRLFISPHGACSNESLNSWRCSNLFEFLNSFKVQNVSHSCHNHSRTVAIISLDYKNKKSEDYTKSWITSKLLLTLPEPTRLGLKENNKTENHEKGQTRTLVLHRYFLI